MAHARLNHVAVCNIHEKFIDKLDLMAEVNELTERRTFVFGKFQDFTNLFVSLIRTYYQVQFK